MAATGIRDENLINNASFTTTITSGIIPNDVRSWVLAIRTGAMTTTPTMIPTIQGSMDGVNFYTMFTLATINAANTIQRTAFAIGTTNGPLVEPFLKVILTFGGAGNFANVFADLIGIPPIV